MKLVLVGVFSCTTVNTPLDNNDLNQVGVQWF